MHDDLGKTWLKGKDGGSSAQTCLGKSNWWCFVEMANMICVRDPEKNVQKNNGAPTTG